MECKVLCFPLVTKTFSYNEEISERWKFRIEVRLVNVNPVAHNLSHTTTKLGSVFLRLAISFFSVDDLLVGLGSLSPNWMMRIDGSRRKEG